MRVQRGRQAPWGVWVKRLGNNALLWAGSGGPVIVFSRRMAVDGEENGWGQRCSAKEKEETAWTSADEKETDGNEQCFRYS